MRPTQLMTPVTAVAALANYGPPWITDEQVRARRHVPVFYAVGMADVNHERMREGIGRVRSAGGRVDLYRPTLGHVLDPTVAQAAVDWWLNDPEHRAILLNAKATEIGFGYAYVAGSDLGGYFTADVGAP